MIRSPLALALIVLGAGAATAAEVPEFALEQIAPGVFVHFGQPLPLDAPGHDDIANIGFIIGERCVAVIDTGGSVRIGRGLRAAIAMRTRRPICYVINTHVHFDHVLGNAAFQADHPSFVGHAGLAAAITRSRGYFLQQYPGDLDQPPSAEQIIGPDQLVRDTLDVIDQLERLKVQRAVPGHGPLANDLAAALAPERRYLRSLLDGVQQQINLGGSLPDAIAHVAESEPAQWLLWDSTHPRNVTRVYQQLEWK
jgi:glyoxylase-like metal-dependent hydrolase (beta-lactamase superfamily II)